MERALGLGPTPEQHLATPFSCVQGPAGLDGLDGKDGKPGLRVRWGWNRRQEPSPPEEAS